MKIYCISSTIIAIVSLFLSYYTWNNSIKEMSLLNAGTPEEAILSSMKRYHTFESTFDTDAFWHMHKDEILKTTEVVEVNEEKGMAVAFKRHTIGSKVFRKHAWLRKIDNKWFIISSVNRYGDENEVWFQSRKEWILIQFEKIKAWELGSAPRWD